MASVICNEINNKISYCLVMDNRWCQPPVYCVCDIEKLGVVWEGGSHPSPLPDRPKEDHIIALGLFA